MEEWKDKVIGSLNGIERASPPKDAFLGIQRKLDRRAGSEGGRERQWLAVAAAILMIVTSNVLLLSNYWNGQQSSNNAEYPAMITTYNIYDNE